MTTRTRLMICVLASLITLLLPSPSGSQTYEQEFDKLSTEMADKISSTQMRSIAVIDFTDLQGNVTELGRFLAEEFSVALAGGDRGFGVVERTHLATIVKEHKLSATGLIDPQAAKELGKIAGVDALITGTITPFGDSVRITVKILDTETATVIGSARGNIAKTEAIEDLLGRDIGRPGGSEVTSETPTTPRRGQQVTEIGGFEFSLQTCELSGGTVACSLLVTNKKEDREIEISSNQKCRIFDELGTEYLASSVTLGSSSRSSSGSARARGVRVGGVTVGGGRARKMLASGIPTRLEIEFSNIQPRATKITILELTVRERRPIRYYDAQTEDFTVQFRGIELRRSR